MIKNYELMVIISPKLSADAADKANQELLTWVEENGGEIDSTDRRKSLSLSYYKVTEAILCQLLQAANFRESAGSFDEHQRNIIRHMFVAKDA